MAFNEIVHTVDVHVCVFLLVGSGVIVVEIHAETGVKIHYPVGGPYTFAQSRAPDCVLHVGGFGACSHTDKTHAVVHVDAALCLNLKPVVLAQTAVVAYIAAPAPVAVDVFRAGYLHTGFGNVGDGVRD